MKRFAGVLWCGFEECLSQINATFIIFMSIGGQSQLLVLKNQVHDVMQLG